MDAVKKCCFCGKVRPRDWRGKGQKWTGVQIGRAKSHWACGDHPDMDVVIHARAVAYDGAPCKLVG